MTRVAVIGLGVMGRAMAVNLVAAGFDVVGFTRTVPSHPVVPLAASLAEAVGDADVVLTALPTTQGVLDVATEVAAAGRSGAVFIDTSTIEPAVAIRVGELLRTAGIGSLDAPVSGGEAGAIEGSLSVMVGGTPEDLATVRPVLEAIGRTIVHVGPAGSGQLVKAANQLIVAGNIQLLSEALVFLGANRVELAGALDVIGGGLAGSTVLDRKGRSMIAGDFTPGARMALHDKDLAIVMDAASRTNLDLPLATAVAALVHESVERGDAALDHSALYKLAMEKNGRELP